MSTFGKMVKILLSGDYLVSTEELKTRLELYLRQVNEEPVAFRWKCNLKTLPIVQVHCYVV